MERYHDPPTSTFCLPSHSGEDGTSKGHRPQQHDHLNPRPFTSIHTPTEAQSLGRSVMALSTMWRGARRGLLVSAQQQGARAASTFASVPLGPPDPIFGLTDAFNKVRTDVTWVWVHRNRNYPRVLTAPAPPRPAPFIHDARRTPRPRRSASASARTATTRARYEGTDRGNLRNMFVSKLSCPPADPLLSSGTPIGSPTCWRRCAARRRRSSTPS